MQRYKVEDDNGQRGLQLWLTVAFVVLGIAVNLLPGDTQEAIAGGIQATVLRPFLWTQSRLADARVRAGEAKVLQARLDSVTARLVAQRSMAEENRRLRALLSLADRLGPVFVPAEVLRGGALSSESMLMLDVGSEDGVRPNRPIVLREGLVGVVREVAARRSIGIDWTHPDFAASAMTADGVVFGIVESRATELGRGHRLVLGGTPFQSFVPDGTIVLSSGLGGSLPRGIPVGRVTGVAEEDAGWQRSYWLEPFAEPGAATHVLVGTGSIASADDVSVGWPEDSILMQREAIELERSRLDSLRILRDSVGILRELLRLQEEPDTLRDGNGGEPGPVGGG